MQDCEFIAVDTSQAMRSDRRGGARRRRRYCRRCCVLPALLLLAVGCDDSGLNLAPAEGVVTFQGKPLGDAGVLFTPVNPKQGPAASGATDAQGRFSLMTANRPGAVVGDHRVAISKADAFGEEVPAEQLENPDLIRSRGLRIFKPTYHIPPRYADVESSGLTATVIEDDNSFEFPLTAGN